MVSPEVLKKIKRVELRTKRMLKGSLVGDYRSAQKGFGLEFEQLSEYQFGDDIRLIDWKSSARMNKLLLKEYREERNRTIMLLVDGSASQFYSSTNQQKFEQGAEVASVIALAGHYRKDYVGLIIVTDEVEMYIPPKGGRSHVHKIMEKLFTFKPKQKGTNLSVGLKHLMNIKKSDTFSFLISDFIDKGYEKELAIVARRHDLVAIRTTDKLEEEFPRNVFVTCQDLETNQKLLINADSQLKTFYKNYKNKMNALFKKYGIACFDLVAGTESIDSFITFLQKRIRKI